MVRFGHSFGIIIVIARSYIDSSTHAIANPASCLGSAALWSPTDGTPAFAAAATWRRSDCGVPLRYPERRRSDGVGSGVTDDPRFQLLIARYGRSLAIALVVVGALLLLVGGWIALTPPTTTATEQRTAATASTGVDTAANVTGDSDLWEQGTELRNNPVYLTNASPTLVVEPRTEVPSGSSVTQTVRLRITATRDDEVFWTSTEQLVTESETVENGTAIARTEIDARELEARLATLRERLAGVGSVQASLQLAVEYDTGRYAGRLESSAPLTVTDRAYWLGGELSDSQPHYATTTRQVTHSPNWFAVLLATLLAALSLTGAWTVFATRPEELDVDAIRQERHRRKYADWISKGSIPMWVGQNYVELDTLEDVVDVAIDTQERVVHDTRRDLFAVISEDVVYYYSKSGDWDQSSWPRMELSGQTEEDTVDVDGTLSEGLGDLPGSGELSGGSDDGPDVEPNDGPADEGSDESSGNGPSDWDDDVWRGL